MNDRFDRAQGRLLASEQNLAQSRAAKRRIESVLGDEAARQQRIGDWAGSREVRSSLDFTSPPRASPNKQGRRRGILPYKLRAPRSVEDFTQLKPSKPKRAMRPSPLPPLAESDPDTPPILPLEVFDDDTYAEFGVDVLVKHPNAFSQFTDLDGHTVWRECVCLGYDPADGLFTIKWKNGDKEKKVPRFNIRFACEREDVFKKRLDAAKNARHNYEMWFRFNQRVDKVEDEGLPKFNREPFTKKKFGDAKKAKVLLEDAEAEFGRANKEIVFVYELRNDPTMPNRDEFLRLVERSVTRHEYGLVEEMKYDFKHILREFESKFLMSSHVVLKGMSKIWNVMNQSVNLTFLNGAYGEVLELDAFVKRQEKNLKNVNRFFMESIQETLDLTLSNIMSYDDLFSASADRKLKRLTSLVMRMLHTVVAGIVDATWNEYSKPFRQLADGEALLPMFSVELILTDKNVFDIRPEMNEFKTKSFSLLTTFEGCVEKISQFKFTAFNIGAGDVSFEDCHEHIREDRTEFDKIMETLFGKASDFMNEYRYMEAILALDEREFVNNFDPEGRKSVDQYKRQLRKFTQILDKISGEMADVYLIGMFQISCSDFKKKGTEKMKLLIHSLLVLLKSHGIRELAEMKEEYDGIIVDVKKDPTTPEELAAHQDYIKNVNATNREREARLSAILERFAFLEECQYDISNTEMQLQYEVKHKPDNLSFELDRAGNTMENEKRRLITELKRNRQTLELDAMRLKATLPEFVHKFQELDMAEDASYQAREIQDMITELKDRQAKYLRHEKIFKIESSPSKNLAELTEEFNPLFTLWDLTSTWFRMHSSWLESKFSLIKPDAINTFLSASAKKITKLKKDLQKEPSLIQNILTPLNEDIDNFKQHMPLMTKLRHPGIKTVHWEKISQIVGFKISPMEMTFGQMIQLGLEKWADQITEIANVAAQEYNIESTLDAMDAELQTQIMQTKEFRDSGDFILVAVEDLRALVDDQLVTTQTLLTSPYVAPVKKRVSEKLVYLKMYRDILEAWVECQRGWLYLQPIFTGTSIQQKLHKEARDWRVVDDMWKALMKGTRQHPQFMSVMHKDRLLLDLKHSNELLESITRGLNEYLEAKRLGFPRFFFLSNDELIAILSHTKDFNSIQKSMSKLFEYVNSITVEENDMITAMNDDGLESVKLVAPVNGKTDEVEDWLNAFEEEMRATLREKIKESLSASQRQKREVWVTEFPAQVILIANQILWTQQVTVALKARNTDLVEDLQKRYLAQLDKLTEFIRRPLSPAVRQLISCLLINEVHNRDIITHLVDQSVLDVDAFKWQVQLRYYWENDTVIVRTINNVYEYSYEYAGDSARLVITPLTDRCYQTLLSAFKQCLSGAPSGPAGTGKTETARDCAKALGRACVVYNCSEEVTPEQMSQFFSGLASSGSWCCFDEFNRINIEVLSVIAQQVRCIQQAIASNVETFVLDQRTLKLNTNAAIIITMNPGYAGRTELPDNLKALFRPCAMMVPDFAFIAEIMLFSGGFTSAFVLSRKLVATFDLCRKQLSNSAHYDWGLRAMKAILTTAGKAKRAQAEDDETLLLVQVITDCTVPRLISADIPIFRGIVHDVFPDSAPKTEIPTALECQLKEAFKEMNAQPLDRYILKCNEILETSLVRHGLMFVGGAMAGKSTSWKVLQKALTTLAKQENEGSPVDVYALNPKAITIPELYGLFDPVTSGWSDGVLSSHIRDCSMSEPTSSKWIIVDGPVDSLWIETMNSLLDDNKVLCLSNNERISLGNHVRMMFEVDDLSQASPATVSRCGMIFFDPSVLPWTALADSWKAKHAGRGQIIEDIRESMAKYIPSMIQFVVCDGKVALGSNPLFLVHNFLTLLDGFLDIIREPLKIQSDSDDVQTVDPLKYDLFFSPFCEVSDIDYFDEVTIPKAFELIFVFCLVWGFGGSLAEDSRLLFDRFLKDLLAKHKSSVMLPAKGTVYDYFVDLSKLDWCEWCNDNSSMSLTEKKKLEHVLVPTVESASVIFFARLMLHHSSHCLFHGPETSKTLSINTLIGDILDKSFDCRSMPMANCTNARNVFTVLRSYMHKGKESFGPLKNQKLVVFLDNLSAVKPEVYGAQPPLELIRQLFDYGGWYNTSHVEFERVVGTTIVASMGPEGAGLYSIPERLLRHFFYIHVPKSSIDTIKRVFTRLTSLVFASHSESVKARLPDITKATIEVYRQCVNHLLPVPSKLHYIFSLRSLVRVIKGMMLVKPQDASSEEQFIRLWANEVSREFHDRFNTIEDRRWFSSLLQSPGQQLLRMPIDRDSLSFNNFSDRGASYKEVKASKDELISSCTEILHEHNNEAQKTLDIVLFNEAVDHLAALTRILALDRGHALLVGVKSSGRKSNARLALYMSQMEYFEIQITRTYGLTEWREDMKTLMKQCSQDISTGFVLSDSQIIGQFQLEDISNILINDEIPNLFERDEMEQIKADIAQTELITEEDPWNVFLEKVRKNLHVILVFSPYGSVFRESMLAFPALRTETTIDWYMPWPRDALDSVAKSTLGKVELIAPEVIGSLVNVCANMHQYVEAASKDFLAQTKRFTACTPSQYFEFLHTFVARLEIQKKKSDELVSKYCGGVEKIITTRKQIEEMSHQLDKDIPMLEQKRNDVQVMLNNLSVKQKEVEEVKIAIEKQAEIAQTESAKAIEVSQAAFKRLYEARPILEAAQAAVESMDRASLVNIKSVKNVHPALMETFEAICIIFGRSPRRVDGDTPGTKKDDYWPETLSLLNDVGFIKKVKNYEVEKMPKQTIEKLKKYVGSNKEEREQKLEAVRSGWKAVGNLFLWVCAAYDYWHVWQEILPLQMEADKANANLEECLRILHERKERLAAVEEQMRGLEQTFNEEKQKERTLQDNVVKTQLRLERAQKIMAGLSGETKRWEECAQNLKEMSKCLMGNAILEAGCLTYLGPFSAPYRAVLLLKWKGFLQSESIEYAKEFSIAQSLGNDPAIREWIVKGLPNDSHSIENALLIVNNENAFPLLIDPQLSGTKWLRSDIGESLVVLRFDQSDFLQRMKNCISLGLPVLIENVGLKLDPLLDPVLAHETVVIDGQKRISIGGEYIQYNDNFRMYLSTKYPNPVYSPEVCSQVTLINFTTTQEGLSDLLMNNLIEVEREDLDKKRVQIMEANAANTKKLKEIEDEILQIVSNAGADILDDDSAIETLQKAQRTSAMIEQQMAASERTEVLIRHFRLSFEKVVDRAALLYFCAADFSAVDPMYQFSLKWFVNIFKTAIQQAEHPQNQSERIAEFHNAIAKQFYQSVSFSLFSRHKLLFSTLMTVRLLLNEKKITSGELAFLLSPVPSNSKNKIPWISDQTWPLLSALPTVSDAFKNILQSLVQHEKQWKEYMNSISPESAPLPGPMKLTPFQKLLVLRVFHLHRVREGLRIFVSESLGKEFVTPPPLNLTKVFKDSSPLSPLIFIITPGIDPQDEIMGVAASMGLEKYLQSYSLGRGRGQGAEDLIASAAEQGMWVLLQNCHLSLSWMPRLERIIDNLDPKKTNPRFRLCLVTMSSPDFPIGILYQGTKLIYEIPKGIRENMMRIYASFDEEEFNSCSVIEKKLLFHLAYFHAVVLERIQFGSIGWNIPYEFNPSDFAISRKQLKSFLLESPHGAPVPFEALTYVIGELNYGGRVTDRWDRRLLLSLLEQFFSEATLTRDVSFSKAYPAPAETASLQEIEKHMSEWPVVTEGTDVGLSKNASTIIARKDALGIFNSMVEIQPTLIAISGATTEEQFALKLVESLISQIPRIFNIPDFEKRHNLQDTVNIVLHHEIILYNKLLSFIKSSLETLEKGLKGLIVIDDRLDRLNRRLLANKIPEAWLEHSFPSILPLREYMEDLKQRVSFLDAWVRGGRPQVFKLGAFFHPEEFLTAVLQVYARKHSLAFDSLRWTTIILDRPPTKEPEDGVYVEGLVMEGAKWNASRRTLEECSQTELPSSLPVLHLLPTARVDVNSQNTTYECPLYRTQNRGSGAMGLPNFIMSLFIPCLDKGPDHWIQRSVAAFITSHC